MQSRNSKRNVQQYFVTDSYLSGFTPEGRDAQLYVYVRNATELPTAPDKVA